MEGCTENGLKLLRSWRSKTSTGTSTMDQILDGLFVGGLKDALDHEQIRVNHIRAVVSIHDFVRDTVFAEDIASIRIVLSDSPSEDAIQHFPRVNSFVHAHRLRGENVLVHCLVGQSRSICFVVAYLMAATNLDYTGALNFVVSKRFCARPNFGFKMQLRKFGETSLDAERKRLFDEFKHLGSEAFFQLRRRDCIATSSLYVHGANEEFLQFSQVSNGSN